jgi:hypothetical protein
MLYAKRIPMNGLSVSRTDGCQSMMKSARDNLWPNHKRKRGKSLAAKALCIRNLFHQDRWWMENYIATFQHTLRNGMSWHWPVLRNWQDNQLPDHPGCSLV